MLIAVLEMKGRCCGCPLRIAVAISLLINLISNNTILNGSGSDYLKNLLNEEESQYLWYHMALQTILSFLAIAILVIFDNHSSKIQMALFCCVSLSLIYEIIGVILFAIGPASAPASKNVRVTWGMIDPDADREEKPAPASLLIALLLLICYLSFKLWTSIVTFAFAIEISKRISRRNQTSSV